LQPEHPGYGNAYRKQQTTDQQGQHNRMSVDSGYREWSPVGMERDKMQRAMVY
jgi:hypothetical protein